MSTFVGKERALKPREVARFGAIIFVLLFGLNATAAPAKRVLVVHSFVNAAPPFTTHSVAFETELTAKMQKINKRDRHFIVKNLFESWING